MTCNFWVATMGLYKLSLLLVQKELGYTIPCDSALCVIYLLVTMFEVNTDLKKNHDLTLLGQKRKGRIFYLVLKNMYISVRV